MDKATPANRDTPMVSASVREIDRGLPRACQQISHTLDYAEHGVVDPYVHCESRSSGHAELPIIDEADRLKAAGLEQVRDYFDRHTMGVILIGMPGIEKRLARYPQLYSRIGFAHEYRQLTLEELTAVLTNRFAPEREALDGGITHATAIATIVRITGGNFRLVDRLLTQIDRVQTVNSLTGLTPEIVDTARQALLIGHEALRKIRHLPLLLRGKAVNERRAGGLHPSKGHVRGPNQNLDCQTVHHSHVGV